MMNGPTSGHAILRALCTCGSCNGVMCGFVTNAPSPSLNHQAIRHLQTSHRRRFSLNNGAIARLSRQLRNASCGKRAQREVSLYGSGRVRRIGVYARSGIISGKTRCGRLGGADPVVRLLLAGSGCRSRFSVTEDFRERCRAGWQCREVHSLTVVSFRNRDLSLQLHG